jgi:hypothetical protein
MSTTRRPAPGGFQASQICVSTRLACSREALLTGGNSPWPWIPPIHVLEAVGVASNTEKIRPPPALQPLFAQSPLRRF